MPKHTTFLQTKFFVFFFILFALQLQLGFAQKTAESMFEVPEKPVMVRNRVMLKLREEFSSQYKPDVMQGVLKAVGVSKCKARFGEILEMSAKGRVNNGDKFGINRIIEVELADGISAQNMISYLKRLDWVEYAEPIYENYLLAPPLVPNDPYLVNQWHHTNINAYAAWGINQGNLTTVIGIVDTGVNYLHPDLITQRHFNDAERFGTLGVDDDANGYVDDSLGYDFGDLDANAMDGHYHGTGVAGTATARANNAEGVAGSGFNCAFMPLKVMTSGYSIVRTMDAVLYGAENGCDVINLSLGRAGGYLQWEQDIFNHVILVKNVSVVVAAGNTFGELDFYPASYQYVLSVAHSLSTDERVTNGSFSTNVDLMAPGGGIWTTYNYNFAPYDYYPMTGSSFASPLTAGVVGLVRSAFPDLDAVQATELVRVTSDNVYALAANAPYLEKIGYGRLNAFRALDERLTAKAARMTKFTAKNRNGNYAFPGDTLEIVCDFKNYLLPLTSNFKIKLRSTSPHVTVIDSVFNAGAMATNGLTTNTSQKYRVVVSSTVPRDHLAKFRLAYSDVAYTDYQYFVVGCNMSYINVNFNEISLSIANNARLGYYDEDYTQGIGIQKYGKELLAESGLLIGKDSIKFSDAVIRNYNTYTREENFKYTPNPTGLANPVIVEQNPLLIKAETYFTDTVANPNAVGVFVKETVTGRSNSPHRKYIIVEYDITNISSNNYDSLAVGIYGDWDIGNANNYASWDNVGKFGYIYKDTTYAAIKVLSTTKYNHFAFDLMPSTSGGNINVVDQFTKGEKWRSLSNGLARNFAGSMGGAAGNNTAHIVGTSIYAFAPGSTKKVYFAIMVGNNINDLRDAAIDAQLMVNPSISPIPVFADSTFCNGGPYVIAPSGGTNFAFYNPASPSVPLYIGSAYTVPLANIGNTFLVTCRDSIVESTPRWISFDVVSPSVTIVAPNIVNISDIPTIGLVSNSPTAVSWAWNFGNGTTSTLQNPFVTYTSSGIYTLTLTVTDVKGCTKTTTKTIQIVRRSPTPEINPIYHSICWEETVRILPTNGNSFKFYKNAALTQLISTGNYIDVLDPVLQNIWVTCIDSLLESTPVLVRIQRSYVRAEFTASPMHDTILYANVNFTDLTVSDWSLVTWEWDFGDGTFSTQRNPEHIYNAQGSYDVKLRVRSSKGCWGEIVRRFRVGKRSPTPVLRNWNADQCVGSKIYITPLNGTVFNFYSDSNLTNRIFQGKNYVHDVTTASPDVIYITCADSLIESASRPFTIVKKEAFADFEYPREILIHVNNKAKFIDKSTDAVSWEWNFGNGITSNGKNPIIPYTKQGAYNVKLTITDSRGCQATSIKTLIAVNKAPTPTAKNHVICINDKVEIKPTGGTLFRFYDSEYAPTPFYVGKTLATDRIRKSTTYYITCIDSAIESSATRMDIILSRPVANFTMSTDSLNLFETDTVYFRDNSKFAKRWLWNFDNGNNGFVPNTFSRYATKKQYRVSLVVFDSLNCMDTLRKKLVVYDEAVLTSLDPNDDYGFDVFPNPTTDLIHIAFSKYGHLPISYQLVSANGVQVFSAAPHTLEKSFESISLKNFAKGFYILHIRIGDKLFNKKVVLN